MKKIVPRLGDQDSLKSSSVRG